jgi:glycosyltransferase involved in cell wall biosynthesis
VVTVHDLTFFLLPQRFTTARRLLFQAAIRLASRRARAVIVPSESTASDLRRLTRVDPSKVSVTYEGVAPAFRPLTDEAAAAFAASRYGLRPGYLLSLGTREPGKNRGAIYRALRLLLDEGRDLQLAVVGGGGWRSRDEAAELDALGIGERVRFTGYIPQEDLPAVYGAAAVFVFPSLHEGFGLAALEAMACGTPVVASDRASLPEVVGEAGLLVDPEDPAAVAAAIASLLDDRALASRLRVAGIERAAAFSWEACARRTLEVYRRVIGGG